MGWRFSVVTLVSVFFCNKAAPGIENAKATEEEQTATTETCSAKPDKVVIETYMRLDPVHHMHDLSSRN